MLGLDLIQELASNIPISPMKDVQPLVNQATELVRQDSKIMNDTDEEIFLAKNKSDLQRSLIRRQSKVI